MRFLISYQAGGDLLDLEITADKDSTVGDLAARLADKSLGHEVPCHPEITLAIENSGGRTTLPPHRLLADAGLEMGVIVTLVRPVKAISSLASPRLCVMNGPQRDTQYTLLPGTNLVGRGEGTDIRLDDQLVSRVHAQILVTPHLDVEVIDINSANGTMVDGTFVSRSKVTPGQLLTIGETTFGLHTPLRPNTSTLTKRHPDQFIRSPRLSPHFADETHPTPELPKKLNGSHFPLTMLIAPIFMGATLFALTQRVASLVFVALMPMMMIGIWYENRRSAKKQSTESWQEFRFNLVHLYDIISKRQDRERLVRCEENPPLARILQAIEQRSSLLWSRRPDKEHFLEIRLGLGSAVSRVSTADSSSGSADPLAWNELHTSVQSWRRVTDVPITADLSACGSIGVTGSRESRDPVAFGLLLQAVGLHSPSELAVGAFLGHASVPSWDWLKWLPHSQAEHSLVTAPLLTSGLGQANLLATDLEKLIRDRQDSRTDHSSFPTLLIVVENDCQLDHARLVSIAETGPTWGIHVLWNAATVTELPATVGAFVAVGDSGRNRAGFVTDADAVEPLTVEHIGRDGAARVARSMAPIVDAGSLANREPDLPSRISYLSLVESRTADHSDAVTERWRETGSIKRYALPTTRPTTLRALIGVTASEPCVVDLANHGPHALVGGTTGSGKSELLQTWVLALASDYSPDRVNFLFVDYKGGSAFAQCVRIPHSVGLVTDLTAHLVGRALRSLRAELQRRERILDTVGAKDIETMERRADPTTPPRLVIVVDEFAALAQEVPDFVDGVVDVAQRGRSLGLHLILATQRPAGVIKENLRANTNLRIALRMADQSDSSDVLGVDSAAYFDPETPGRAAIRSGPGRLTHFQTAYVGGHTMPSSDDQPKVRIAEFKLGSDRVSTPQIQTAAEPAPGPKLPSPTDLQRLVASISQASIDNEIVTPTRPWLPELAERLDLVETIGLLEAPTTILPWAMSDRPELQTQPIVGFDPDRSGNLAIYGTGGSGKSTALRSLAIAACLTPEYGPTHVYGLDYGSRGLAMLEPLPHVGAVIDASDVERVARLMRTLQDLITDRAVKFAAAGAATLPEYRAVSETEHIPRILVLLDGLAAFRKAHEASPTPNIYDSLLALATDGRPVGVHVVVTADRPGTVPAALASVTPAKVVLRLANENDAALLNVPRRILEDRAPPGRGLMDDAEVQIAVLSGSASVGDQSRAVAELCREKEGTWTGARPETIGRLEDKIKLVDLPTTARGSPTLGVSDDSLSPIGFPLGGPLVVTGPPGSGRTTAVASMVRSFLRIRGERRIVLLSPGVSALTGQAPWDYSASNADEVVELLKLTIPAAESDEEGKWLFIVEDAASFVNSAADLPLQALVETFRSARHTVLGEGDTQSMQSSWPLLLALRRLRRGVVLQPDQSDGDLLLRTPFPRLRRGEFPLGRGLLVVDGQTHRVQVAI